MDNVIRFPIRSCPPHSWEAIYDGDGGEDIAGRICLKCSLIETRESLTLLLREGEGFLSLWIEPIWGEEGEK